ncbi:MAG: hypothetical protein HYU66_04035 [Armatimonadetes bacterium]|nr:hypothetical protein [Armatimonadota bacterium]
MPPRPLEPFADSEELYRGVEARSIGRDGALTSLAVTVAGTSFDRATHQPGGPRDTLARKPNYVDVAAALCGQVRALRATAIPDTQQAVTYRWTMIDDPLGPEDENGPNDAHCQAVCHPEGAQPEPEATIPPGVAKRARTGLVTAMRLLHL